VGHFVEFGPVLHRVGLAGHILALVLAFGTILVVDWLGLLWLMGKVHMHESPKLETAAKPLIWGGLALLLASGALIQPDLTNPVTAVKLGLRTHPDAQRFEHRAGHAQNVRASAGNTLQRTGPPAAHTPADRTQHLAGLLVDGRADRPREQHAPPLDRDVTRTRTARSTLSRSPPN
jgi:hypothetical protein